MAANPDRKMTASGARPAAAAAGGAPTSEPPAAARTATGIDGPSAIAGRDAPLDRATNTATTATTAFTATAANVATTVSYTRSR